MLSNKLSHYRSKYYSIVEIYQSNYFTQHTYSRFSSITVEPLLIEQSDLNTKRMLDLMAVSSDDGRLPLYLHSVYRILREMRMDQQEFGEIFNYGEFKSKILGCGLTPQQLAPLEQRLDTLESFMPKSQTSSLLGEKNGKVVSKGTGWKLTVCHGKIYINTFSDTFRPVC